MHDDKCTPHLWAEQVDLQGNVNKIHNIGHGLHKLLSVTAGKECHEK